MALLTFATSGCQRTEAPPSPPPADPAIVLATPEDAARSLLHFLRADLEATARGDSEAARAARDQVAWHIMARDAILARDTRSAADREHQRRMLNARVQSWAAALAYYADGLALDEMRIQPGSRSGRAVVLIPAHTSRHPALVRIACVPGDDGRWLVGSVDFAAPTSAPATQP